MRFRQVQKRKSCASVSSSVFLLDEIVALLGLPFGQNRRWFSNVNGMTSRIISGCSLDGITVFSSGFPLVMTYAIPTTLESSFGAGTPRTNVIADCKKSIGGSAVSRISEWFNTSCFSAPSAFGFGNESRKDPTRRGQGIDNWEFSGSKETRITEGVSLEFRGEIFNRRSLLDKQRIKSWQLWVSRIRSLTWAPRRLTTTRI